VILLDTNILIAAGSPAERNHAWARALIADRARLPSLAVSVVALAELQAGGPDPHRLEDRLRAAGIRVLDLPVAAALPAARAWAEFLERRRREPAPVRRTPLPDFFIGAHALVLGATLATADVGRYRSSFPELPLIVPPGDRSSHLLPARA
jgi:predicted nucleic acid-binding protein